MSEQRRVAVIATKGTLDEAYPPLNVATVAASMGAEVAIFFTFDGLYLLHPQINQRLPLPSGKEEMRQKLEEGGIPSVPELIEIAKESGIRLFACQMTMDVMGIEEKALVPGIESCGAAAFLEFAFDADTTLTF